MTEPLPHVELKRVTYVTPMKRLILNQLDLVLGSEKSALVGRNGVGKSTLARLVARELEPSAGDVITRGRVGYVPQLLPALDRTQTVAEFLGVAEKLAALERAERGELVPEDADLLAASWTLRDDLDDALHRLGIEHISLQRQLHTLSGGELRRLFLVRVLDCDFLVLDEPTNDLDVEARALLRRWLSDWKKGWLLISHDRDLLALAEGVAELTEQGMRTYSGNFEAFLEAREQEDRTLAASIRCQEKAMRKTERTAELATRRQWRRTQKAEDELKDKGINRTLIQVLKERAQQTAVRTRDTHAERLEEQAEALARARARVRIENRIEVPMGATAVAPEALVVRCDDVAFSWTSPGDAPPASLFAGLTFEIRGPERISIMGRNGCGKTTLLRLLTGEIAPDTGTVSWGEVRMAYLDQQGELLDESLTLAENVRLRMGTQDWDEVWNLIRAHRFPLSMAERPVATLSGGERLRAGLIAALSEREPPQLLLLDEPTNNLDLASLEALESALCNFEGALIVVSHETTFLKNVGITQTLRLPEVQLAKSEWL